MSRHRSPESQAQQRAYKQSPEGKAYQKAYHRSPARKARAKAYRESPEGKAVTKAYNQSVAAKASQKAYRKSEKYKTLARASQLKICYGITQAEWDIMFYEQGGECAICKTVTKLCVDHDHASGRVRGLLCNHCNSMIGHARESQAILQAAQEWLAKHGRPAV